MSRRILVMLAVVCVLAPLQARVREKNLEKPQIIKLDRFRKALWKVHVTIQGKAGDFLLDTGGGMTLLTEDFARGLDCRFWGRTTGYNMFGKKSEGPHCDNVQLKAGDVALTPVSIGKIDFGDQFSGDKTPDGLLALDAFDGKVVSLDQKVGTLTIETPASLSARIKHAKELPVRLVRDCSARCLNAFIGVPTPQGMTWLILDSGAGGVSLISRDHAAIFGLNPQLKEQRLKFEAARDIPIDSPVMLADMIMDGNLGQPFMSRYVITFDLAHSRLWLAPVA